ncbi:MAG: type II toxin-antitoxin system RelE/ParE family toxin [Elusimicrobiota bacterium]
MKVRLLAVARQELDDAVAWYDEQATELGREFLDEIDRAVRRAAAFPLSCPEIEPGLRRCLLARFPYGLIFGVDGGTLVVVAVAHLHREPRYWVDRL